MSKREKLFKQLLNNPHDATFAQMENLLLHDGFVLDRVTGSHHVFKKENTTFVLPLHGKGQGCVRKARVGIDRRRRKMNGEIKIAYPFVIYPAEEGGYVTEIPALKGC